MNIFRRTTGHRRDLFESLEDRRLLAAISMTDQEQLLVELVNRTRANPVGEASRFDVSLNLGLDPGTISPAPKQPLAPNEKLIATARGHSQDMLNRNFFAHDNPDGDTPSDRAKAQGYETGAGENIAWLGTSGTVDRNEEVRRRHEALFLSEGHRVNMLREFYREIGNGIRYGRYDGHDSIMVTENFGSLGGDYFVTGVAYTDNIVIDRFYTIGEGLGGLTVSATRHEDGASVSTETGPSGGYALEVPNGTYAVIFSTRNGIPQYVLPDVKIDGANEKVDYVPVRNTALGSIQGFTYHDVNENARRDGNEPALAGWTVFWDIDRDGFWDTNEISTRTATDGSYLFDRLAEGEYEIRPLLPSTWSSTSEDLGAVNISLGVNEDLSDVSIGLFESGLAPVAAYDVVSMARGAALLIDVVNNDTDQDGSIDATTVEITQPPRSGSVTVNATSGRLTYTPKEFFVGEDRIDYTVADDRGNRSNVATVDIRVVAAFSPMWQNPVDVLDVNGDGFISSIDALFIFNELNGEGPRRLLGFSGGSLPPPYLDTNGDNFVTSVDALWVFNFINSGIRPPSGEDESVTRPDVPDEVSQPIARQSSEQPMLRSQASRKSEQRAANVSKGDVSGYSFTVPVAFALPSRPVPGMPTDEAIVQLLEDEQVDTFLTDVREHANFSARP